METCSGRNGGFAIFRDRWRADLISHIDSIVRFPNRRQHRVVFIRVIDDLWQQAQIAVVMSSVVMITLVLMLLASGIHKIIGTAGASVISRVMGLLLAAVAIENMLAGIKSYFSL